MLNRTWPVILLIVLLTACAGQSTPAPATTAEAESTAPSETPEPAVPLPSEQGDFFSTAGACSSCHANMTDESGKDVTNATYWRGTMMANAARDPYWRATVRRETLLTPDYQAVIEDKCATCHTPMAHFTEKTYEQDTSLFDDGFLSAEHPLHPLAIDGVSCTVCHQIQPDNLGNATSFSGGYLIDAEAETGERALFGPYPTDDTQALIMSAGSGFNPVESAHIQESAMCATCHTLFTPTIDEAGEILGEFPEQTPFLEWLNSDYPQHASCQGCHMPHAQGGVQLSVTGGEKRSPFSKHNFVGGNAFMVNLLKTHGNELEIVSADSHFEATAKRIHQQLEQNTATIAVENAALSGETLSAEITIESQTGHKFPTGFPSRRAWLHVTVIDGDGKTVFESGAVSANGVIAGNDNDADAAQFEPHYQTVTSSEQVQIYETIIVDPKGDVTSTLIRGLSYTKDNRLLPLGFDPAAADADIAVYGQAADDADFVGGSDRVVYQIDVGQSLGPFTLTAELLYQSIGYRWADNLRDQSAPEIERFLGYYDAAENLPIVVAGVSQSVE